jgi:hypothetical protein
MYAVALRWCRALILLSLLVLSACSSTTFVYNRLDFILPWYLDDYAELNGEQEEHLDTLLSPFLSWHRSQELPRYIDVLEHIETTLDRPLTPEDVASISAEFERAWFRLEGEALDWLLELGASLTDEQIDSFMAALWEQQHEYEEKYLERSEEEFYEDSYDNLVDSAQDYLGKLSTRQRDLLLESSRRLLRSDRVWLEERTVWLGQMGTLLQRDPGWQQRMRAAIAARNDTVSPQYQRVFEHNLGVINSTVAELLNSRTDKQDRHVRGKLADLRQDLETLVAQGKKPEDKG